MTIYEVLMAVDLVVLAFVVNMARIELLNIINNPEGEEHAEDL